MISEPNTNDDESFAFLEQFDTWTSSDDSQLDDHACLVALHGTPMNPKHFCEALKKRLNHVTPRLLRNPKMPHASHEVKVPSSDPNVPREIDGHCLFCSTGTIGVVDLGASQSVIGSDQLKELLEQLPPHIHRQVKRQPVDLTFRFGNHQTLQSKVAVHFPLQQQWFRVAVVPGKTPFLLSSNFLQGLKAAIDTHECTLWNKVLQRYIPVQQNAKNLMLMDINNLWGTAAEGTVLSAQATDGVDKRPSVGSVNSGNSSMDTTVERGNDVAASESVVQANVNMRHVCHGQEVQSGSGEVVKGHVQQVSDVELKSDQSQSLDAQQPAKSASVSAVRSESVSKPACATSHIRENHVAPAEAPELPWKDSVRRCREADVSPACRDQDQLRKEQGSDKVEHRRYLQYVKLRLEEADQGQEPIQPKTSIKTVVKKSPGPSTMARPVETEEESDWEQMSLHTQHQNEMESRMNRMEEAPAVTGTGDQPHPECLSPRSLDSAKSRAVESHHENDPCHCQLRNKRC
eukprot:s2683_g2.t1